MELGGASDKKVWHSVDVESYLVVSPVLPNNN